MSVNKVSALFMAFIIAMSLMGLAYAHWSDIIRIEGIVKMAHIKMTIISYKNLTSQEIEEYSTITSYLSDDGHVLTLNCKNLKPCWFIWIGLKMQNQGSLPVSVKSPEYSFDTYGFQDYFEIEEYFYGPYPKEERPDNPIREVWDRIEVGEELLDNGTVTFTPHPNKSVIEADPDEKVVIWIWIHCKADISEDAQGKTVTLYIKIVDDIAI